MMKIALIAAMGRNRIIGKDNSLPWKLPADMRRFVRLTKGKSVIMGRRTFESIGEPLKDRKNIVLTRNSDYEAEGCVVVNSVEDALKTAGATEGEEIMVIGGASIYEQLLPRANRIYLTLIDGEFEGDAKFPEFDQSEWKEVGGESYEADEKNPHDYRFVTLVKKE